MFGEYFQWRLLDLGSIYLRPFPGTSDQTTEGKCECSTPQHSPLGHADGRLNVFHIEQSNKVRMEALTNCACWTRAPRLGYRSLSVDLVRCWDRCAT